ncbi:MAG: carbonic anhydrase [Rhodospirillales bacterium]|nr:carbonic anhydrase [Rhodospirillales bacterium]
MDLLIEGYRRFRARTWDRQRTRFRALADSGQRPQALVVACADSRVDPQMIFDAAPGELFVVRNVANLVPPYMPDKKLHGTSAALEFGVRALAVPNLIVIGHAMCGGIQALLQGAPKETPDFVESWVAIADPARQAVSQTPAADRQQACEHEAIRLSLRNLDTFPWIRDRVAAGRLRLDGYYFDIRSGILMRLGADGVFAPVPIDAE